MNSNIKLTLREREVLNLIAEQFTSKEIGVELNISSDTVETYRKRLREKLNAKNSVGIVLNSIALRLFTKLCLLTLQDARRIKFTKEARRRAKGSFTIKEAIVWLR